MAPVARTDSLGGGIEIEVHGVSTRLLAWPGTGYQTESVHVLTLQPADESASYTYDLAEEAMLCNKGSGEVWLHDRWVEIRPGDVAYFPEGVEHAVRNPRDSSDPLVLVTQITPPQLDLYTAHGFYNEDMCVMDSDAIQKATLNVRPVELSRDNEMAFHDTQFEHRNWNMQRIAVRSSGALFNVFMGAPFTGIGIPMRLILWPGAGSRSVGLNFGFAADGTQDTIHTHPISDECLFMWEGKGRFFVGDRWVDAQAGDCVLAPCGVAHGHFSAGDAFFGGFASPPQLDLLMPTEYYDSGESTAPESTRLQPG